MHASGSRSFIPTWTVPRRLLNQFPNPVWSGSGPGRDALYFTNELRMSVCCLDFSLAMVALCKAKALEAHVCDFCSHPLEFPAEGRFDAIYAMNSLLHVPKVTLPGLLTELARLLIPGGLLYVGMYGGEDFEGPWDDDPSGERRFFAYYTDEALKKVLSAGGFEIIYFERVEPDVQRRIDNMCFQSIVATRVVND